MSFWNPTRKELLDKATEETRKAARWYEQGLAPLARQAEQEAQRLRRKAAETDDDD